MYSWRQKKKLDLENTPWAKNFDTLLYVDLMQKHNIHEKVTAEDETSSKAEIKYCQKTDDLIGFCGKKGKEEDGHKCSMPDTRIIIGDDESSYSKLTEAFRDRTIASYARVILLNPATSCCFAPSNLQLALQLMT